MGIYLGVLILLMIGCRFINQTRTTVFFVFLLLFVISAGRAESVGIDTVNYYNNYFSSSYGGENHKFEIVFIGLCDLIRNWGLNPRCCLYLLSGITVFFVCAAAYRYKVNVFYALFFFVLFLFFTHSLNIARQIAACSILLYAYSFILVNNGRSVLFNVSLFALFVILAASFHIGAILGFVALGVYLFRFKWFGATPFLPCLIFIILFAIIQIFRSFLLSQSIGYLSSIAIYDSIGSNTTESSLSLFGFLYRSIAYVFWGTTLYYIRNKVDEKLYVFFFISVMLRIILSMFYGSIFRLSLYFSIIDIIVFSFHVSFIEKNRKIFFVLTTLFYFGIDFMLTLIGNTFETVPYQFKSISIF